MRPIKFRAWHPYSNKMITELNFIVLDDSDTYSEQNNKGLILMQFTGLHDKNGKEIYEGDIIKHTTETYIVEWTDKGWWIRGINNPDHYSGWCDTMYEIIGNIFENPDLLGGK